MQSLINWFEIPVTDFKRAVFFYEKVFRNVKFELTEFNGIPHAIFRSNTNENFPVSGALVETQNSIVETPRSIIFFNGNQGMTEILDRVTANGGTIKTPKTLIKNKLQDGSSQIPKTLIDGKEGYFAYFYDTEGNLLGLYANS
jgi:predicted enzyme related to lactoylglutathione lyase